MRYTRNYAAMLGMSLLLATRLLSSAQALTPQTVAPLPVEVLVQRLPESDLVDLTKEPLPLLPDATVQVEELGINYKTDKSGTAMFALQPGQYTFRISVQGTPYISRVRRTVTPQRTNRFALQFNTKRNVYADHSAPVHRSLQETSAPGPLMAPSQRAPSNQPTAQLLAVAPTLPAQVDVYSPSQDKLYRYPIETYVQMALAAEVGLGLYQPYLTNSQELTMFKAKAVVTRTYATYHTWYRGCARPNRFNAKLDDTTWCQTLDHGFVGTDTNNINAATTSTYHQLAVYVTDSQQGLFQYIDAVFFASDKGTTQSALSVWGTNYPYLQQERDTYDEQISNWICTTKPGVGYCPSPRLGGYAGHGVGFSQDGAAGYAKHGYSAAWIVSHFYRGTQIYTASESSGP